MNNKEINALLREVESRDALSAALKGGAAKEFIKERNALEKSLGGKAKIEKADAVLVDAEKEYARIVGSAKDEADRLIRLANDGIKAKVGELENKSIALDKMKIDLDLRKRTNEMNLLQFEDASKALSNRQKDADQRDTDLSSRQLKVSIREAAADKREAEIKRHNEWLKSAPA